MEKFLELSFLTDISGKFTLSAFPRIFPDNSHIPMGMF
jgi:hypothetical protein